MSVLEHYLNSGKRPERYPLYIDIVALARSMVLDIRGLDAWQIFAISGAIFILAVLVPVGRYGHVRFPYADGSDLHSRQPRYFLKASLSKETVLTQPLMRSSIKSLPLINQGKVRDIYDLGPDSMLLVATDRLSAFDVVLPTPIADKGAVLTQIANFWFDKLKHIVPNHLTGINPDSVVVDPAEKAQLGKRAIVVKKLKPLPIEAIVRGYLAGSGWKEYNAGGTVCGIALPAGLQEASKLPEPIFTPSSKAEVGDHDINISLDQAASLLGEELAEKVSRVSILLYKEAAQYALTRGIIIADTKFEFGLDQAGELYLIDEALTPDSSRFWPADQYAVGKNPPSFDKQYVRDWLEASGWDKKAPGPELPDDVAAKTGEKYREAYTRLTGREFV